MKKSTANHMHRKRRKNNLTWLFALLGILVLFLGTILAFLIFSNLSSHPPSLDTGGGGTDETFPQMAVHHRHDGMHGDAVLHRDHLNAA